MKKIREKITYDKNILNYDSEKLDYVINSTIGRNIYTNTNKCPRGKSKPNDRIECNICGKIITRSARTNHNKTKVHKIYENAGKNFRELLLKKNNKQ